MPGRCRPPQREQQRDPRYGMRDEQRQIEQRRHQRVPAKPMPGEEIRQRRSPERAQDRRGGGGERRQEQRIAKLAVDAETRYSFSAPRSHEPGDRSRQKKKE